MYLIQAIVTEMGYVLEPGSCNWPLRNGLFTALLLKWDLCVVFRVIYKIIFFIPLSDSPSCLGFCNAPKVEFIALRQYSYRPDFLVSYSTLLKEIRTISKR